MLKRILAVVLVVGMLPLLSGCLALLAGAGGTVLWQGGKVISEESSSMKRAVDATKAVFKSEKIALVDEVARDTVTQLRGEDSGNTKVAVDIFEKAANEVRIEIRYGLGEEKAGRDLLLKIKKRL
jgi:hypothetical protein